MRLYGPEARLLAMLAEGMAEMRRYVKAQERIAAALERIAKAVKVETTKAAKRRAR